MGRRAAVPTIYDASMDVRRPVTQEDVDTMLARLEAAVDLKLLILQALGLPPNAQAQIARVKELGGIYALSKLAKVGA